MGMYDTMNSGNQIMSAVKQPNAMGQDNSIQRAVPNAAGQGFAQQKQPMMKTKPANAGNQVLSAVKGASFGQPNTSQRPNPMTGARPAMGMQPGQGGSRDMMQLKMQQLKAQQAGSQMGSYNELASSNPQLQQARQTGQAAGQDMSWMDKPGALQLPQGYGQTPEMDQSYGRPQSGLNPLQSPYERQIQESKPNAIMGAVQDGGATGSMGRTYGRPMVMPRGNDDLQGMASLYGTSPGIGPSDGMTEMFGGQSLQQMSGGQGFQPMNQPVQMDENGLEPRRGPR